MKTSKDVCYVGTKGKKKIIHIAESIFVLDQEEVIGLQWSYSGVVFESSHSYRTLYIPVDKY